MPQVETQTDICASCGALTDTSLFGDESTCMACLLRLGFADTISRAKESSLGTSFPDHIGPYVIARRDDGSLWQLGHGAMGITFRATDESLQRPVALKIINTKLGSHNAEVRERFTREARAAAALRHPNVATVHQFGVREETGQFFYAMELVEGETLEERVRRLGPLDVLTTIDVALQVTAALAAAEKRGLVHRDLKPGNLMLVGDNVDEVGPASRTRQKRTAQRAVPAVKVIDFGVAKAISEKTNAMALTHGGFVGTPAFASPEQFNNAPVDVRSDIYSLGATLWFLLTGHMLFSGRTVEEIRDARRSKPLPIKQLKTARVPRRLITLLRSMLAIEPAARPAGASELAAKLQAIRASITGRRKAVQRFAIAAAVIALATIIAVRLFHSTPPKTTMSPIPEKSVAVLPFENLSADPNNAWFVVSMQDEILTRAAKIAALKVISRSSTQRYEPRPANLRDVAKQLGVAHILEGSVQKIENKVHVNVQLIKVATDAHVWAESYDRELTDVFAVEAEIASRIANSLNAAINPEEKKRVAAIPTTNPDAYEAYLQGREVRMAPASYAPEYGATQRARFERAIALDPEFALAHAALSEWYSYDCLENGCSAEQRLNARREADEALRLQPDLGEAHKALGWYYYGAKRNYDAADKEFAIALQTLPNDAELIMVRSLMERRRGHWRAAIAGLQHAVSLDPRNLQTIKWLSNAYAAVRDYALAEEARRKQVEVASTFSPEAEVFAKWQLCHLQWIRTGNLAPMQSLFDQLPQDFDRSFRGLIMEDIGWAKREPQIVVQGFDVDTDKQALSQFFKAQALLVKGETSRANEILDGLIHEFEAHVKENPSDAGLHSHLGLFYAYRGRKDEAIREGRRGVELLPENKDAALGPILEAFLAMIYARVGDQEASIDLIERLLTIPCEVEAAMTKRELQVGWSWDPLRQNPRFQKILNSPEPKLIYN